MIGNGSADGNAYIHALTSNSMVTLKRRIAYPDRMSAGGNAYIGKRHLDQQFAVALFESTGAKLYGRSTSQTTESLNNANKPARELDATAALSKVVELYASRFTKNKKAAQDCQTRFTPKVEAKIKAMRAEGAKFTSIQDLSADRYKVRKFIRGTHVYATFTGLT